MGNPGYNEVAADLLKSWIDNLAFELSDSTGFLIDAIEHRARIQPDRDAMHFLFGKFDFVVSILQQLIEFRDTGAEFTGYGPMAVAVLPETILRRKAVI